MTPVLQLSKRIEFRYSRHDKEIIVDRNGLFPSYTTGDLVERRGKTWKATHVSRPHSDAGVYRIPVLVVNLTESR
ncbi:MAG TPA: hypothetical protein VL346_04665 [Acidobacteriaceae bacterium]|nr:hypothetical protein [Acidobacteriaceae bacterium]